jgi:membrane protease YdiL (CAAX protease family)
MKVPPWPAGGRSAFEVLVGLAIVLVWLWNPYGSAEGLYPILATLALAVIGVSSCRRRGWNGLVPEPEWGARRSWLAVVALTVGLGLAVVAGSEILRTDGEHFRLGRLARLGEIDWLLTLLTTVVVQQLALHLFLTPSLLDILRNRPAARTAAGAIFGLLHLPSVALAGMTASAAIVWSWVFHKSGRIAPLIACHLALSVLTSAAVPERLTYNLGVGSAARDVARRYQMLAEEPLAGSYAELRSSAFYDRIGADDRAFIEALFRKTLRREAPSQDVNDWVKSLQETSRADVVGRFLTSQEASILRDRDRRISSEPLASLFARLKSDTYYRQSGGTDRSFIRALYGDVFQRQAGAHEIDAWLPELRRRRRADVVSMFLTSEEFDQIRCAQNNDCRKQIRARRATPAGRIGSDGRPHRGRPVRDRARAQLDRVRAARRGVRAQPNTRAGDVLTIQIDRASVSP